MSDIKEELDQIDDQIYALQKQKSEIVKKQIELLKKGEIKDIIKDIVWEHPAYPNPHTQNLVVRKADLHKFDQILDLLQVKGNWHFEEEFWKEKVWICLDDGEHSLRFHSTKDMYEFISEYDLKIDLSDVDEQLKNMRTKLMEYASVRHKLEPYEYKEKSED